MKKAFVRSDCSVAPSEGKWRWEWVREGATKRGENTAGTVTVNRVGAKVVSGEFRLFREKGEAFPWWSKVEK